MVPLLDDAGARAGWHLRQTVDVVLKPSLEEGYVVIHVNESSSCVTLSVLADVFARHRRCLSFVGSPPTFSLDCDDGRLRVPHLEPR